MYFLIIISFFSFFASSSILCSDSFPSFSKKEYVLFSDQWVIKRAKAYLRRDISFHQTEAILEAHRVGKGLTLGIKSYRLEHLFKKSKILKDAGFSTKERKMLMEMGVVGYFNDPQVRKQIEEMSKLDHVTTKNLFPEQVKDLSPYAIGEIKYIHYMLPKHIRAFRPQHIPFITYEQMMMLKAQPNLLKAFSSECIKEMRDFHLTNFVSSMDEQGKMTLHMTLSQVGALEPYQAPYLDEHFFLTYLARQKNLLQALNPKIIEEFNHKQFDAIIGGDGSRGENINYFTEAQLHGITDHHVTDSRYNWVGLLSSENQKKLKPETIFKISRSRSFNGIRDLKIEDITEEQMPALDFKFMTIEMVEKLPGELVMHLKDFQIQDLVVYKLTAGLKRRHIIHFTEVQKKILKVQLKTGGMAQEYDRIINRRGRPKEDQNRSNGKDHYSRRQNHSHREQPVSMVSTEMNPYEVLGIKPGSRMETIKKVYRELAKQWHPDHNSNRKFEAEEQMKKINEAYRQILTNDITLNK